MEGSEFGHYGVLRFMKRHEETVIASYPIDEDELTFGCDPSCSVRLYYPTVSPLHAKIIFQERKAFIEVLGVHGLLVDQCYVFPATTTTHTTVPLINNSQIEINKKRFRFEYPPKALRPALVFTPPPSVSKSVRKRVLRLSMIQSAQVFTPRPDPDPRVNLRVLQTPIRLNSSQLKHAHSAFEQEQADEQDQEHGTPIRLVEGNRPQVVEEEQDLVILEEVDAPDTLAPVHLPPSVQREAPQPSLINPMQSPVRATQAGGPHATPAFPLPPSYQSQQFQTPRRRPARPSLHRAVLIRSVQRAVMRVEMEKEQEQEEREVEEHVIPIEEQMEVDERDEDGQEAINEEHGEEVHEDGDDEGAQPDPEPTVPKSGWRKSLEAFKSSLQTFRSPSTSPEKTEHAERGPITGQRCYDDEYDDDHSTNDENEPLDQNEELQKLDGGENPTDALGDPELEGKIAGHQRVFTPRQFTPQRPQRPLSFMTPQVHKFNDGLSLADRVRGRKSTGGVSQASMTRSWLVTDTAVSDTDQEMSGAKAESGQRRVSQSEKQAIQERRRSALVQPDMFFGGNIPGSQRSSSGSGTPATKTASVFASPSKVWDTIKEDDEEAETSTLLEKMKEVVEGMQRRRSIQPEAIANVPISSTPEGGKEVTGQQYEIPEDNEVTAEGGTPLQTESRSVIPSSPATPHMSDLKHVFSEKRVANMPTSYAGVVKLFKAEPSSNPETPRLDGVREMFFREREREPNTPIFEGIGEMLTTPPEYDAQEFKPSDEIDSIAPEIPAPSLMPLKGKPAITGSPSKPSSGVAEKTPAIRPMNKGRATPADLGQLADDELTPDVPPARPTKYNANAPKGSIVRRTTRRVEREAKEDMAVAPAKSASKTRKPAAPETTELTSQPKPAASVPEPIRRSRTTTRSVGSTDNERVESSKSTRKTMRGTKGLAAPAPAAGAEPVAEPAKSIRRGAKRSQSVDVATAAATIKRRVAKSKASDAEDASRNDGLPETADRAELPEVPPVARVQRGRTEPAETEDENAGAGAAVTAGGLRNARGRRTPTAGVASNRVIAAAKARAVASSGKSAQVVGEKENTPERVHVKEEEEERQPAIVIKGVRTRKTAAAAPKAQSEPEKDGTTVKTRAPRTRAASARK